MKELCELPQHYQLIAFIVVLLVEGWLGKTEKVKSGSILESIFNVVLGAIQHLKQRK
jgi:hypothetical protein